MWHEKYLGKPWMAIPNPPHSYTCGELARTVLKNELDIDSPQILANAKVLRECVQAMQPEHYNLVELARQDVLQDFDVAFLLRGNREDHVGLVANTNDGIMILHCVQGSGVIMDSIAELLGTSCRRINFYRHKKLWNSSCPV